MYEYPPFDGTQSCRNPPPATGRAFVGAIGADPAPALALCDTCGFITTCRTYALTYEVFGVWGGTTDVDRDRIRVHEHLPAPISITDQLDELVATYRRAIHGAPRVRRAS